ncbi:MAG: c-type cytochrome [Bacteroidia bacterium]|nr:c-type cytochrome [Bacteroidia bacterium]
MSKFLLVLTTVFLSLTAFAQDGEKLFNANCKSCHAPTDKRVVGPGLAGVEGRWKDRALLYKWIKNNKEVLASGDSYANELYNTYNKSVMTIFPALTDKDIDGILKYVAEYKAPPDATPVATEAVGAGNTDSTFSTYTLVGLGLLFLMLMFVLINVRKTLAKVDATQTGETLPTEFEGTLGQKVSNWISHNKKVVAVGSLVIIGYLSVLGWNTLSGIGIYEGYQPDQPIKFSHKLHAGKNAVSCIYCHGSAERGKAAGVPSANVCMNCHKYIQEGPVYGKVEIAKIYAALDYNPDKQTYGNNPKPIKWIKVHNLPDHVYFNHAQHVVVGKVECQKCHGPVQEMDTIRQYSQLTMGWCINCHRETKVSMEGNGYYKELHDKLAVKYKGQNLTVSKIGGLECSKCHY